jgi:hypothetical protein
MGSEVLKIFLPSFIILFICITFFWKWFRKATRADVYKDIEKTANYPRLKRINIVFKITLLLFGLMTLIYTFFPEFYFIFMPLDQFDHPLINSVGLLALKISLIWMLVAQLHIDKEVYKYSRNTENLSLMELVYFSERMFLSGLMVMFIGMFVTITNAVGIALGLTSIFLYFKLVYKYRL